MLGFVLPSYLTMLFGAYLDGMAECRLESGLARMRSPPRPQGDLCANILPAGIRAAWARYRNLSPTLKGALRLLCSGDTANVFLLTVHLDHPIS
jgi:hypothetical protein